MSVPAPGPARSHSRAARLLLLLFAVAIVALIVFATRSDRDHTLEPTDPSARGSAATRGATQDAAVSGTRQPVADTAVGEGTLLCGTVRLVETGEPATGGSIQVRFVDCRASGMKADALVGVDPESLSDHCEEATCAVTATGQYEQPLPPGAFLVGLTVEPAAAVDVPGSLFAVRFGAFARREFAIGQAVSGVSWRRDLEVTLGARLTGVVLDAAHRTPLTGALVTCASSTRVFELFGARTNAAGTFAVGGLVAEPDAEGQTWKARVSCTGYLAREISVRLTGCVATDITVALERGIVLAGRVVDPQGNGVASAQVTASAELDGNSELGRPLAYSVTCQTGADGAFEFSVPPAAGVVLRANGSYRLSEEQWAYGAGGIENLDGTRTATDLRLELQSLARFHVRAFYPGGEPVPEDDVSVLLARDGVLVRGAGFPAPAGGAIEIEVFAPKPRLRGPAGGPPAVSTSTSAIAYRGRATCVARHPAGSPNEVDVALDAWEFTVPPPLPPRDEEQVYSLSMDSPGAHLGCVRDLTFVDAVTGRTLGSTGIGLEQGGGSGRVFTSGRGRMRLTLPPGQVVLRISVDGFEPRTVRIQNPASSYQQIEVRMQPQR